MEAPTDPAEFEEVIGLQEHVITALEVRVADRERALQRVMCQRLLGAAPEVMP